MQEGTVASPSLKASTPKSGGQRAGSALNRMLQRTHLVRCNGSSQRTSLGGNFISDNN